MPLGLLNTLDHDENGSMVNGPRGRQLAIECRPSILSVEFVMGQRCGSGDPWGDRNLNHCRHAPDTTAGKPSGCTNPNPQSQPSLPIVLRHNTQSSTNL